MGRIFPIGLIFLAPLLLLGVVLGAAAQTDQTALPAVETLNVPNPTVTGQLGGPLRRVATGNGVAYATVGPSLTVLDVDGGGTPQPLGSVTLPEVSNGVAVSGTHVLIVDNRLRVIDVADPAQPVVRGLGAVFADYRDVDAAGGYAYAVAQDFQVPHGQLHVYDVRDAAAPEQINVTTLGVYAYGIRATGSRVYVANGSQGLRILNVANPAAPAVISTFATQTSAYDVDLSGNYAYVLVADCLISCSGGVEIVDVSLPQTPQSVGFFGLPERPERIHISGQRAYVAGGEGGTMVLDIANPTEPAFLSMRHLGWTVTDVAADAGKVLAAAPDYGLAIYQDDAQLSPAGSFRTTSVALDVAGGAGSVAYVGDGAGLRVVDLDAKAVLGVVERDRPVRGTAAAYPIVYLANDSDGLVVVDVTTATNPVILGYIDTPGTAHDVALSGDYAFVADGAAGLRVIDVSDPEQPVEVGALDTPGDARAVAIAGDRAYVADWDRGVRIADVSNPAAPVELSFYNTPGQAAGVDAGDDVVYVADSLMGLRIIDVSNVLFPLEIGELVTQRYVEDVARVGSYVYVANDNAGLLVVDVANPSAPVEVGSSGSSGRTMGVDVTSQGAIFTADWLGGVRALSHEIFSLSGAVSHPNGVGIAGVDVVLSSGASNTTGAAGSFSFDDLPPGSYTVTPTLSGYVFMPPQQSNVVLPENSYVAFTMLTPPFSTSVPAGGQKVAFADTQGLTTTLDFPNGAVTSTRTVIITPTVAGGGTNLNFAGHALDLAIAGGPSDFTFGVPVTLAVRYSEDDLRAVFDEASLALYWWNGHGWLPAEETCEPAGGTFHDLVANDIRAGICRTGRYALLGEQLRVFLPFVSR